jgi:hypothetical protein
MSNGAVGSGGVMKAQRTFQLEQNFVSFVHGSKEVGANSHLNLITIAI